MTLCSGTEEILLYGAAGFKGGGAFLFWEQASQVNQGLIWSHINK